MPTKPELQASAAVNLSAIQTHADRLAKDLLALYVLDQPPVVPPVVTDPPIVDPPPPVDLGDFGYDGFPAALVPWVAKDFGDGGLPASVQPWASGNVMEGFDRINPKVSDAEILATHRGLANGSGGQVRGLHVRRFRQTRWNKWGWRDDEIQQLLLESGTVQNDLGTPQSIEHWGYAGLEGWAPGTPHAYTDYRRDPWLVTLLPEWGVTAFEPFMDAGQTWASLMLRDMAVVDVHRCGLQQVQRDFHKGEQDAVHPDTFDSDMGPVVLVHSLFRNVNYASGSGSGISLFASEWWGNGPGTPGHRQPRRASQGAILIDTHVDNGMQEKCDGAGFAQSKKYVVHHGCTFLAGGPTNRSWYKVENCAGPVTLIDSRYDTEGGQDVIDLINCTGPVSVLNCKGTARLRINGVEMGRFDALTGDIRP